jgi:hypothetical protein
MLRKTIYGVADQATLGAIAEELGRDREVHRPDDGSIEAWTTWASCSASR